MTSRDNFVFLQRWFNKFPQYKHRDLYISGGSYVGHYIPQLASLMVQFNKKENIFNLKGIVWRSRFNNIPLTGSRTLVQKLAKELGLNFTVPYRVCFEGKQINCDPVNAKCKDCVIS